MPKNESNFDWLTLSNYKIEEERSFTKSNGSTLVFKTRGAHVSIILLNDFEAPNKNGITSAFFVPFQKHNLTKTINFLSGIFLNNMQ